MNIVMIEESKLNQMMNMLHNITQKLDVDDEKEVYTPAEVAKAKNLSYQTVMNKIHSGEYQAINENPKGKKPIYRIMKEEFNRIMNRSVA